jgi:hypothetical protein
MTPKTSLSTRLRQKADTLSADDTPTDTDQKAHYQIQEGDRYRDELNNTVHEVTAINGNVAKVVPDYADSPEEGWRERVGTMRSKLIEGDYTPVGETAPMAGAVAQQAEVPRPGDAQLLYPDAETARQVADSLGLDGVHEHSLDGDSWYMPGSDHAAFEDAMSQQEFAGYEDFDACVADHGDKDDPEAYCASIMREVKGQADTGTGAMIATKAEFDLGEQVMWEYSGGEAHGVVREVTGGEIALPNGAEREAPEGDEMNYVVDEWDDENQEWDERSVVKSGSELDESQADLPDPPADYGAAVTQRAEFSEGAAVRWSWQGNPVHGRVAEVREQATVSGNTITGEDGETDVYLIDEWDEEVEAYRRENVAKPESSLNESGKDIPPRSDGNYVNSQAWDALTTPLAQSSFSPAEMDYMAAEFDGLVHKARPNEWIYPGEEAGPVVYRAEIPDKYLDGRSEEMFVPNAGVADAAQKVKDWREEHGADNVAGGAADGEGARRATQLIEYHDRGEPLAVEYWEEIANYHDRHHPQGNHELDSEYEGEPHKDAGYVSHLNWGGDPGYEQAQRVMDVVESVDQEAAVKMQGAVATEQSLSPDSITKDGTNEVDLSALEGELREAVEADNFYIYGKASIEQWDDDHPPTYIQMDALEGALNRYFESELAPGIISRHHQDIPVGKPVREFEFQQDTTLQIDGDEYHFAAGDTATSHVEDADGDGRPELWLAANIDGETEMGKKTRVLASQGDLNGFSVTVHRNDDEMTSEGRYVTDCDLHAVTIGTDEQIKNPGSEFDVAAVGGKLRRVADVVRNVIRG